MGRRLSKKERAQIKEKHRLRKISRLESEDAKGISRKRYKLVMSPKTFFIMKGIGIVLIPLVYFAYSPFLILVMFYFVGLFFAGIGLEHYLNKSVIKSNHIHIPKYDSAIALLLISIGIFGSSFSAARGKVGMFANTIWFKITQAFNNMGSLLTGVRNIFSTQPTFGFGAMDKPDNFIPNEAAFLERMDGMAPPGGGGAFGGRPQFELSMDDIPVEFMFSQVLSTVTTVLIIAVGVFGALSLYYTFKKIKNFNIEQNEVIVDNEIKILEDDEIRKILDFGDIVEEI
ncbi:MAG: hypothetical protein AB7U79_03635 [Candidatus Izemoplasmatales bacterium]